MAKKKSKKRSSKSKNSFVNTVLNVFVENPYKSFNFKQVSANLGISDVASRELVKNIISDLSTKKIILEEKKGKYKLNPEHFTEIISGNSIEGIVDMKPTGKAYIIAEGLDEDIFIAANNTNKALHGDKVKVLLFPKRKGHKIDGQIVEVLERKRNTFVGTIQKSKKYAFLVPDNKTMHVDIYIHLDDLKGAQNGQKAIAKLIEWPKYSANPFGEIIDVLGDPGNNDVEMNSILAAHDFPLSFPKEVENDASKIKNIIPESEIKQRKDFRNIWTCTIDPFDAKDFDDAISLKKLKNGNIEVGIHIADVAYYVKPDSPIDKEAYQRGTSIYLVDRVIPMLPEKLSNFVCSLRPNEEKLCFSAVFELDEKSKVLNQWFGRTIIKSDKRYNYAEVQSIIEGGDDAYKNEILELHQHASKLRELRFNSGSIAFRSQEVKFELDESGKPIGAFIKEQKESNHLVEEFMLLANRKVAEFIGKPNNNQNPKTFIYRVHDEPNPEKLQTFSEFISKLGYKISLSSRKSIAFSFNNLFKEIEGKGEENMIETIAVRTMSKASYSTDNIGHYGLAFKHYTHFTSPIRRYPDLMTHRLLDMYLSQKPSVNKEKYEEKCDHCSIMERNAISAERESVKYKQAEFLLDKVGEEFNGLISGVSKWGIFVQLDDNKCEGMVSLKDMIDDFYYLDDDNYCVIGQRYGHEYKLGDPVRIRVKRVDLQKKMMDFEIV
ncbi:MAG: ribonuclease R [Saprospiraceae bacterium]|nr:ribonuclease R [Saprospiraceae bacterium]